MSEAASSPELVLDTPTAGTGRAALVRTIAETLGITSEAAMQFLETIRSQGYLCVPVNPTDDMRSGAWAEALAEDAVGVWQTMIGVWEGVLTSEGIPKEEASH